MKDTALERLFRLYYNEALLYVCSFSHDIEVAKDVVSEAYLRAIKSIDEEKDGFKYWLFKVARNCYFDYCRKSKRQVALSDELPSPDEELADRVIKDERYKALYHAISLLDDQSQEAVRLYYFDGMSVKETASIMSISCDNVKVTLYRSRNKLKKLLEDML